LFTVRRTVAKGVFHLFVWTQNNGLLSSFSRRPSANARKKGEKPETDENTFFYSGLILLTGCFLTITIVTEISCFQFK
jgi:hypothetical protein